MQLDSTLFPNAVSNVLQATNLRFELPSEIASAPLTFLLRGIMGAHVLTEESCTNTSTPTRCDFLKCIMEHSVSNRAVDLSVSARGVMQALERNTTLDQYTSNVVRLKGFARGRIHSAVKEMIDEFKANGYEVLPVRNAVVTSPYSIAEVLRKDLKFVLITTDPTPKAEQYVRYMTVIKRYMIDWDTAHPLIKDVLDAALLVNSLAPTKLAATITAYIEHNKTVIAKAATKIALDAIRLVPDKRHENIKERIRNCRDVIERLTNELNKTTAELDIGRATLLGLEVGTALNPMVELADYLTPKIGKEIAGIRLSGTDFLYLTIDTELTQYDSKLLEPYFNATRGDFYRTSAWVKAFIKDAFMDDKYTILVQQTIGLTLNPSAPRVTRADSDNTGVVRLERIAHPHVGPFNCFGSNERLITGAIAKGDYVVAYEQSVSALRGINFADVTVFNRLIARIASHEMDTYLVRRESDKELITFKQYREEYNALHQV